MTEIDVREYAALVQGRYGVDKAELFLGLFPSRKRKVSFKEAENALEKVVGAH